MNNDDQSDFFESGFYENFWGWEFEEKESQTVAKKSIDLLGIKKGHILDWCGGWGRISYYLAKMGYQITILDFIENYLKKAQKNFADHNLTLNTIHADCRKTPQEIQADHAICSFNSIGFFSDNDQLRAFQSLNRAIKNKGRVIIDCINLLFIARYYQPIMENTRPDGIKCIQKNRFDLKTSTLHSHFSMIDQQGQIKATHSFQQRLFTPLELEKLLLKSGFTVLNRYGNFSGDALSFDLPQIIIVLQKN